MTEETAAQLAERNARRLEIVKRVLGDKYAHHPAHFVQRRKEVALPTFAFVESRA